MELLKRLLNFAVACGKLTENPIARVKLLRVPNVRRVVLDEEAFQRLSAAAERWLRPILRRILRLKTRGHHDRNPRR